MRGRRWRARLDREQPRRHCFSDQNTLGTNAKLGVCDMYGLINLAGRQLLPNILASLAFSRTEQLRQNAVLHSDNRLESDLPAQRLFELLERDAASGCVELLRIEVDETLQGVTDEVLALFAEFPGLRWILHATGGNKMMSAALVDLARHPLVAAVVYRDIVKGWHQVTAQPDGALVESPVTRNSGVAACLLLSLIHI